MFAVLHHLIILAAASYLCLCAEIFVRCSRLRQVAELDPGCGKSL